LVVLGPPFWDNPLLINRKCNLLRIGKLMLFLFFELWTLRPSVTGFSHSTNVNSVVKWFQSPGLRRRLIFICENIKSLRIYWYSIPKMLFFVVFFETGSLYVAQAGFELSILLPQLPECWDYRCALPHLAKMQSVLGLI
jgi:hypothetical protein